MIRHNKTAHTANDYSCADCDVSFSRREDLGRHVRKVHNEKTYYRQFETSYEICSLINFFRCCFLRFFLQCWIKIDVYSRVLIYASKTLFSPRLMRPPTHFHNTKTSYPFSKDSRIWTFVPCMLLHFLYVSQIVAHIMCNKEVFTLEVNCKCFFILEFIYALWNAQIFRSCCG